MRKRRVLAAIAVSSITLGAAGEAAGGSAEHRIVDEMAALERRFEAGAFEDANLHDLRARIDDLASRSGTDRAGEDPKAVISALNRLIFTEIGIQPTQDLKDPNNLLLSRVLERKRGYCVGIAALYLALAERLDLPIYAVATPSHVFLRFDDRTTRVNIETVQGGAEIPDDEFVRQQRIPRESIRRGVFMRNLTTDEFLAQVHNNLGVIYSERKDYRRAAEEYDMALDLDPRLPAAHYNYGSDLLRKQKYSRAARSFSRSLRQYATDVWALNNRGLAYLKLGKRDKARRDFEAAIRIDPAFEQARRNLAEMQAHTSRLPD